MTEYAPDTATVKWYYERIRSNRGISPVGSRDYGAEFDRWLTEHDRQVAEAAVDRYIQQVNVHIEMWGTTVDVEPWPINEYRKESE